MKCHYNRPLLLGNLHQPDILTRRVWVGKEVFSITISNLEMRGFFVLFRFVFLPPENGRMIFKQQAKMSAQICSAGLQPFPSQHSHVALASFILCYRKLHRTGVVCLQQGHGCWQCNPVTQRIAAEGQKERFPLSLHPYCLCFHVTDSFQVHRKKTDSSVMWNIKLNPT